jgi:hypothetical protein
VREYNHLMRQVNPVPTVNEDADACFNASVGSTALGIVTAPETGTAGLWVVGIASVAFAEADHAGLC